MGPSRHIKISKLASGKILDVGYVHAPNLFLTGDVTGLDLDKPDKKLPNYSRIIVGNATKLSEYFDREEFDTVIAGEIIEHLTVVYSFRKLLVPSGKTNEPGHLNYQIPRKLNELLYKEKI